MGRRPSQRCSDCEHWQPGEEWHSTAHPSFMVISLGECKLSGKYRLNCDYRCLKNFKQKEVKGIVIVGNAKR